MRTLLFHRDFQRYSGGHGKVWDYFTHATAAGWAARVHLTPGSVSADNPWRINGVPEEVEWVPGSADALFLGGMDWEAYTHDDPATPVLNLIQHVRHGTPADPRHRFLARPAVRICVSAEVAAAITRETKPNGPLLVIEAGIELPSPVHTGERRTIFIDAIKQPDLGEALAARLATQGYAVVRNDQRIARATYLARMGRAGVAVVLPRATEGFYLPGLEAMALGCASIVPDCVGNRAYLKPGVNALSPALDVDELEGAVRRLDDQVLRARIVSGGRATAERFTLARERAEFHRVLEQLPTLWKEAAVS